MKTAKFCLSLLNRVPPETSLDPTARELKHLNSVFGMVLILYMVTRYMLRTHEVKSVFFVEKKSDL